MERPSLESIRFWTTNSEIRRIARSKIRDLLDLADPHRALDQHSPALFDLDAFFTEQLDVQSVFIKTQIEVVEDRLDDLTEGQRDDREVVALQAQNRNTDQETGNSAEHRTDQHGQCKTRVRVRDFFHHHQRSTGPGKSTHAHETRMSEAQFPEDPYRQVQ